MDFVDQIQGFFQAIDFGSLRDSVAPEGLHLEALDPRTFDPRVWIAVGGLALLLFGRRLYALALGAAGFAIGWSVAPALDISDPSLQVGAGVLLGVLAAMLAFFVQSLVLSVGGFILGVSVSWWAMSQVSLGALEPLAVIGSGILSAILMQLLFSAVLVALSSFVGASLLVQAAGLGGGLALAAWAGVSLFGIVTQTRGRGERETRRKRKKRRRRRQRRRQESYDPA